MVISVRKSNVEQEKVLEKCSVVDKNSTRADVKPTCNCNSSKSASNGSDRIVEIINKIIEKNSRSGKTIVKLNIEISSAPQM